MISLFLFAAAVRRAEEEGDRKSYPSSAYPGFAVVTEFCLFCPSVGRALPNALITYSPAQIQRLTPPTAHRTSDLIVSVNLRVALINEIDDPSAGVIAWTV